MVLRKVGKYEVGRTIGEGTFAKVKFAQNTETGESVAMKVLDRSTIIKHKMADQIKREISIMKLVRHPYVVRLHEVIASRTKIYIILEFITGGELFDKIVRHGRLNEAESKKYFQQLIDGVDCCHSKGVYHRDLKPENLLLDSQGNLKISDFGLSALPEPGNNVLWTTCGTPNYVAPEVLSHKGYNGAEADVWSCGVILFVLMAGYLPFDELDLTTLYSKIENAEFSCPSWFPVGAKSLIHRILDANPKTRITVEQIRENEWFKNNYHPVRPLENEDVNLDDVNAALDEDEDPKRGEETGDENMGPLMLNAFDLIILSQGLNLSTLFDRGRDTTIYQTRFISQKPANVVLSSMEVVAQSMGFKTRIRNYKMRVEGILASKTSHFSIIIEVFEVAPTYFMVDIQKSSGDAAEYLKFYKNFCVNLGDIVWRPPGETVRSRVTKSKSKRRPRQAWMQIIFHRQTKVPLYLAEHQEVCGNRTELCVRCNKYIRLRDRYRHGGQCNGETVLAAGPSREVCTNEREQSPTGQPHEYSPRRILFTIAITGIAILLGSIFFKKKVDNNLVH